MKPLHAFLSLNFLFFLLSSSLLNAQESGDSGKTRPNILFIAIDDQNDWIDSIDWIDWIDRLD